MVLTQTQMSCDSDGILHLLHLTDFHLFADPDRDLLGIKTSESFHAVLDDVQSRLRDGEIQFDQVLATGDLTQDHTDQAYRLVARGLRQLERPVHVLPGNHDEQRESFSEILQQEGLACGIHLVSKHWQVLMLDTQIYGKPAGELAEDQLALIEQVLTENPEHHTLLAMHHNMLPVGSQWLDQHRLKNAEQVQQLLSRFPQVKGVLFGHVHQEVDQVEQGVRFLATPSTCLQFMPNSQDFSLDNLGPGWRTLQLHPDGQIQTRLYRLEQGRFLADTSSNGY